MPNSPTGHRVRAPSGDLGTFTRDRFEHGGVAHDLYRKGNGLAVIVLAEMPGISPQVLGFADRLVAIGCSVALPDLFGEAGRDPLVRSAWRRSQYTLASVLEVCVSREFTLFATGRSSKVVDYLRGLAEHEHAVRGGAGVGVVGMCFTGGFALAMATTPSVIAPVMSQPSLPFPVTEGRKHAIDCSAGELEHIANRCSKEGLRVLGLRFKNDPIVPAERFAFLRERLGDGFVAIEIDQKDGHPKGPLPKHHSVLTVDLIDEPGEPTLAALNQVLDLMRAKLLSR